MPRRSPVQREHDLSDLARRYLQGEPQASIAVSMGVSQPQISFDLRELQRRWQAAAVADLNEAKGRELAKIDLLEREFYEAWKRSRSERTISSSKKRTVGANDTAEASLRREQRDGNPAFLEGVLKCIERRCRIWGIDAPERNEVTGPGGGPIEIASTVTDGDRALRIAALLELARQRLAPSVEAAPKEIEGATGDDD